MNISSRLHAMRTAEWLVLGIPVQTKRGKALQLLSPTRWDWRRASHDVGMCWEKGICHLELTRGPATTCKSVATVACGIGDLVRPYRKSPLPAMRKAYAIRPPCAPRSTNSSAGASPTPLSGAWYKSRQQYGTTTTEIHNTNSRL